MSDLLLWLSGVDREVLARCPSERTKFIGIGGAVLTTAVIATMACTLTLVSFVGVPVEIAILIGCGWGLAIMNLDRWLVASTRRQDSTLKTVAMAIPRILLAIVIGLVIAEPLVLKIFDSAVELESRKLVIENKESGLKALDSQFPVETATTKRNELQAQLDSIGNGASLLNNPRYKALNDELQDIQTNLTFARQAVICEVEGRPECGSGREGRGPAFREKEENQRRLEEQESQKLAEIDSLKASILQQEQGNGEQQRGDVQRSLDDANRELAAVTANKEAARQSLEALGTQPPGLLERMEALERLVSENSALNAAQWVLRLFILALDSLPVLVKTLMLLGKPSLYDQTLDTYERERLAENEERASALERAAQLQAQVTIKEAEDRRDLELAASRELAQMVVEAQKELAAEFIGAWKAAASQKVQDEVRAGFQVDVSNLPPNNAPPTQPTRSGGGSRAPQRRSNGTPGNGPPVGPLAHQRPGRPPTPSPGDSPGSASGTATSRTPFGVDPPDGESDPTI
jgi:hypothetical protein